MAADVIVFQRPMQKEMLEAAKLLKQKGKVIIYDNDDTYTANSGVPKQMSSILEEQIDKKLESIDATLKEFVSIADVVTTTTEFLADEYRPLNPNTVVLPNMVDPDDWSKPKRNEGDKIRIGLVGSVVNNQDYTPIKNILKELSEREDVQLVILGLPPKIKATEYVQQFYKTEYEFWQSHNIEWQPFVPHEDYNDTLNNLALDIMLIPRADNYFNRCKSNVKFLEAAMCQIPVIAQSFPDGKSPYEANPKDKDYLLLANSEDEWREQIEKLMDKQTRRELGEKAYEYVTKDYNIKDKAHLWKEVYQLN